MRLVSVSAIGRRASVPRQRGCRRGRRDCHAGTSPASASRAIGPAIASAGCGAVLPATVSADVGREHDQRFQQMIAVSALAGDVQRKVDLGRRELRPGIGIMQCHVPLSRSVSARGTRIMPGTERSDP